MNAFGGFIQIGSSVTAEIFFSVANDFFETDFQGIQLLIFRRNDSSESF